MELNQLRAFIAVLDCGSFLHASRQLKLSRSTLRSQLDGLEGSLGQDLLLRTHRGVVPTDFGTRFAQRARGLLRDAESLADMATAPEDPGELRLIVPVGLPPLPAAFLMTTLRRMLPSVRLISTEAVDPLSLIQDDTDSIVHYGDPVATGSFRTFALLRVPVKLMASRSYLEQAGRPRSPEQLSEHTLLSWAPHGTDGQRWPLQDGDTLPVQPAMTSANALLIRTLVSTGQGIGLIAEAPHLDQMVPGEAVEIVLEGQVGFELAVRLLVPEARQQSPRCRAAIGAIRVVISQLSASNIELFEEATHPG